MNQMILEQGDVQKPQKSRFANCCSIGATAKFTIGGSLLLAMLAIVPVWNAASLLQDFNYVFWAGPEVPQLMIILASCMVPFFALIAITFLNSARPSVLTEQNVMNLATTFITLFGLGLMIFSLFLTQQADVTSSNLLYNCELSPETHRLYEYSQVLQNIRALPECALKFSVEECAGYKDSPPYTDFLKNMETNFDCAGFCYRAKPATPSSLTQMVATDLQQHVDHVTPLSFASEGLESHVGASSKYPPTLFSDVNWQASCESMAARDMKNYAGDIGIQTFFQGIYLVCISVITGFLKLLGFCLRRKESKSEDKFNNA